MRLQLTQVRESTLIVESELPADRRSGVGFQPSDAGESISTNTPIGPTGRGTEEEMSERLLRVLLIESDLTQCREVEQSLAESGGYLVDTAYDVALAWEMVQRANTGYDVVLLNDNVSPGAGEEPKSVGLELKKKIEDDCPETQVSIYTGCGVDRGCDSLRAPELLCLGRSFSSAQLASLVYQAAEKQRLKQTLRQNETLGRLLQSSAALLGGHSEDEVLESILRDVQSIGFDRARLYLLSENGTHVICRACVGMGQGFLGQTWPLADDEYMQTLIESPMSYVFKREPGKPKHSESALAKEEVDEWACVPLRLHGKVIGSLSADNKYTRRAIQEAELVPVALFTSLATAAIENARLLRDAQHRAEQLELLRKTTLAIGVQLDPQTLLETIILQAVSLLGGTSGSIFKYHSARRVLTVAANYRRPEEKEIVLDVGEGMAGRLVVSGLPYMIVDDYDNWDGRAPIYEGKRRFEAVVQVPLKADGEVIGVLSVDDRLPRKFTEEDAKLLSDFADHAAITLGDSELTEREARKVRRLEGLSPIASEIADDLRSRSLEERLNLIAQRAAQVLEAEACGISWIQRDGYLSWEASHGHMPDAFSKGREFAIVSEPRGGLSGHIAKEGRLFNEWGPALRNHWAVKGVPTDLVGSENCYSLLALPLKDKDNRPVGLLRVENKLAADGSREVSQHFTPEDELILKCFGHAVVVAVEAAALVDELKEKTDHLERLVDSSPNGIISIDVKGKVTGFNDRAREIMGHAFENVEGTAVSKLYYPEEEAWEIGKLLDTDPDKKLAGYETCVRGKLGEIIPIRLSATWLYDASGKRIGSVGYFEDLRPIRAVGRWQELLLKASNTLAHAEDLRGGLNSLAKMMVALLGHTFCRILIQDENEPFLATEAVHPDVLDFEPGWKANLGWRIHLSEWKGLYDLLKNGEPLVLRYADDQFRPTLQRLSKDLGLCEAIDSLLFVPLKIDAKVVGFIEMAEMRTDGASTFSDEEIDIAGAIASQTTMLIERMRLLEQARSRSRKLSELFEDSNKLVSDEDIGRTLQDIVERTKAVAEAGLVRVILFDAAGEARIQAIAGDQFREFNLTDALREKGISMQVMEARKPRWIEDVSKEDPEVVNQQYLETGIKAGVCFPLLRLGESMGVMWINYDHPRSFSDEQKLDLQLYVNQAAIACGNAWRINEMQRFDFAAKQMSGVTDLTDVLRTVVAQSMAFFHADSSALASYDHDLGEFLPDQFVGEGIPETVLGAFRDKDPTDHGITRTVLTQKYLTVPHVMNETREFMKDDMRGLLRDARIASFQGIAVEDAPGKCLGVLYVSFRRPQSFTEEDRRRLNDFAAYAALSIRKARLLDQVDKARKAAGIVARAAAQGIERTLSSIAIGIQKGTGAHAVTLYACGEADGYLKALPGVAGLNDPDGALRRERVTPGSVLHTILNLGPQHIAENVPEDVVFGKSRFAEREGIQSCCASVLTARGNIVGILFVNYRTRHRFTADELSNIEMFANQAGVAIANTQLFDDLESQLREHAALLRLSEALIGSATLQDILDHAAILARGELATDYCSIVLPDKEGNLILSAADGWPARLAKARLGAGRESQAGYTIETKGPVISLDYSNEKRFDLPRKARESGVVSGMSVPMWRSGKVVGAMVVQTKRQRQFLKSDVDFLSLLANQTAIAVERLELYEAAMRKKAEAEALYSAAKAIADASRGFERKQILDRIVEQAVKSIARRDGTPQPSFGTLQLYDQKSNELVFESVYPREELPPLIERLGERRALFRRHEVGWRIGITGRTVIAREPQLIDDVTNDRDYLPFNPATKSELTVPLIDFGAEPVLERHPLRGVLNVESDQVKVFTTDDVGTLQKLAALAVIAINNAEQYEELRETKGLVGSRTALAWMGLATSIWRHSIEGHAIDICNAVTVSWDTHNAGHDPSERLPAWMEPKLTQIEKLAKAITNKEITPPLGSEEDAKKIGVNDFVKERLDQRLQSDQFNNIVNLRAELTADDSASVSTSPEWIRYALDMLVNNSIKEVSHLDQSRRTITVTTRSSKGGVEIVVADQGRGIAPDKERQIFVGPVEKAGGMGMGLLIAQAIVEAYRGKIYIDKEKTDGLAMVIWLPSAKV